MPHKDLRATRSGPDTMETLSQTAFAMRCFLFKIFGGLSPYPLLQHERNIPLITLTMHDAHHYRMSTRVLGGLTHEFFERMLKAQHNMNPSTDHPAVLDGVDAFGLLFPWAWNLQRPRKGI